MKIHHLQIINHLKILGDSQIFKMTENIILANESEKDDTIKWDEIRKDIENIYTIWPTISLDLTSVGINNMNIGEFDNLLDNLASNVKNKDKELTLINLSSLYGLMPKYVEVYLDDDLTKKITITKSFIVNAYVFASLEKWDEAYKNINLADETFLWILQNKNYYKNNELNINRANILISNLKNSINKYDKQIFYLNYKNLLQEISII